MKLAFYPAFADRAALTDHYYRLHWYLYPFRSQIREVILPLRSDDLSIGEPADYLDDGLSSLTGSLPVSFRKIDDDGLKEELNSADCIFQWAVNPEKPHAPIPGLYDKRTIKIDHRHLRFAGSYYLKFPESFEALQAEYLGRSRRVFDRIRERCAHDVGYIFGTGPGLAEAAGHDFSDGVSIACNSMVRNQELLDRLKPPLIVIADPIFHAGPSSYAGAFRKQLIAALDRYEADLIVPMRDYHIYLHHLPDRFAERIAAVPFKTGDTPNLDLAQSFHVTSTGNVLTLFLLPLAATFFKDIRIFGCDGRPLEANSYFWNHDKASQFNEQMSDIKVAHPAFFAIDYDDYYQTHCKTLESWLEAAENLGKRVTNHTPSYIPALVKRSRSGPSQTEARPLAVSTAGGKRIVNGYSELISLDPDAVGHFGHYLSYDARLGEAAHQRGLNFSVLGSKNFELDGASLPFRFDPGMSVHSFTIGNKPQGADPSDVKLFAQDLRAALERWTNDNPGIRAMLYMYCGGLEHVEIIDAILEDFQNIDSSINLFYTPFMPYRSEAFAERWKPVLDNALASGRISLTVPTVQLQIGLNESLGVALPLAPHPSSTFSDDEALRLSAEPVRRPGERFRILFPGGMRPEKGFDLTVRVANALTRVMQDADVTVRARPGRTPIRAMVEACRGLDRKKLRISDEDMSDREFSDFLAACDIIVLPYRSEGFAERTSGILIDSLLIGRPVVVLENTWLAELVRQTGIGVAVPDNVNDVIAAIQILRRKHEIFRKNIEAYRRQYHRKDSWAALIDAILTPPQSSAAGLSGSPSILAGARPLKDARLSAPATNNDDSPSEIVIQSDSALLATANAGEQIEFRQQTPSEPATSSDLIVSIDPDGVDTAGHFIAYNKRLMEASHAAGADFCVIGNKKLDETSAPPDMKVARLLNAHSWEMGTGQHGRRSVHAPQFEIDLRNALRSELMQGRQRIILYMYCGSLEHAVAIQSALGDDERLYANVNLFWQSFVDYRGIRYVNRWRPFVMALAAHERITLTVPTRQVRDDMERLFGLSLPVAPHPSTTFSDISALQLAKGKPHTLTDAPTILFPGGMRTDKGFPLTVDVVEKLSGERSLALRVRTHGAREAHAALLARLEASGASLVGEDLDDEAFRDFLASGDVIVCPYLKTQFAARTSGLVIDAMLLGRPVVALKDTWLGEFVSKTGIGVAADPDAQSIITAIRSILENYDAYATRTTQTRIEYLAHHSWKRLIESLVSPRSEARAPLQSPSPSPSARDELIKELPSNLRSPIFLPTERIPIARQIEGLERVKALYSDELDDVHRPRLRALKAARRARRCFIIGNGPSLSKTDLSKLKKEVTFATNGFFLKLPDLSWAPTYYVVEDHLVAEDRAHEINMLRGFTKLFPASLSYILKSDPDTVFFDHRPRKSWPDGFDFSFDADVNTYAGGTVTFTCMQLAAYLGYEEIYLVGVDADYSIPPDATLSGGGRVKEIDMQSDDPNHFHPDYFGKGKRWHEPNVDVMLAAYKEAKQACEARGVRISNATIGGKLEVFPRIDFHSLFPATTSFPRVLLIDHTRIGDVTATGELKAALFKDWPASRLLQFYDLGFGRLGFFQDEQAETFEASSPSASDHVKKRIGVFDPDIILYRPVPRTDALHSLAKEYISQASVPLALWIMDDWPTALKASDPAAFARLDADWRALLKRSVRRFSISDAMSMAFEERYGVAFESFANGIDPAKWPKAAVRAPLGPVKVRYAGSLAENMTLWSVVLVANAVEKLARAGHDIVFEIKTRELWHNSALPHFEGLTRTSFVVADLSADEYRKWLSGADVAVIAYNFDETSVGYVRYSVANKLPECLASGAALLAVGPAELATMEILEKIQCGVRITEANAERITDVLAELARSPERRFALAQHAQRVAFDQFNINKIDARFAAHIAEAAKAARLSDDGAQRSDHAYIDETAAVAHLLSSRRGREHVMLDIGAHYGSSASYFHGLQWTIHCFEPDSSNREHLSKRFRGASNVTIDPRAVSDKPATGVSFFTSEQSTGISGLHAFHSTHKSTAAVDVTTIAEIVAARGLKHVDFLKIDVEGFDFSVLKGVPWDCLKPDVIECEFEDAKTAPMGHTWRDIADFLRAKGYAVYISEWHPIVRYGVRHDWRRIAPYSAAEIPADAWGNLLAFRQDPGYKSVRAAFNTLLTFGDRPGRRSGVQPIRPLDKEPMTAVFPASSDRPGAAGPTGPAARGRAARARLGQWLSRGSPKLFGLARFAARAAGGVWRRRLWTVPALLVLAAIPLLGFAPAFADYRWLIWGGGAFATAMAAIFYLALRVYQFVTTLSAESASLHARAADASQRLADQARHAAQLQQTNLRLTETATRQEQAIAQLVQRMSTLAGEFDQSEKSLREAITAAVGAAQASDAGIEARIAAMRADSTIELNRARASLLAEIAKADAQLQNAISSAETGLKAEIARAAAESSQDARAGEERVKAALAKAIEAGDESVRAERAAEAARLRERIAAGERQIGAIRYPDAPKTIVFFGHHKCASRFFRREVFEVVAEMTDARLRKYEIKNPPFHYSRMDELDLANIDFSNLGENGRDVVLFANSSKRSLSRIRNATKDWKGVRVLRDPRQVLVSDYFHHMGDHHTETFGWVWDALVKDQPILRELPKEEGLLHELDNISKQIIEEQLLAPFDDDRVLTLKVEDFNADPRGHLKRIAEFLEVPDIAGIDLMRTFANRDSGPWQHHFTSRLREAFKERYGQALIDLGYASDMDW